MEKRYLSDTSEHADEISGLPCASWTPGAPLRQLFGLVTAAELLSL